MSARDRSSVVAPGLGAATACAPPRDSGNAAAIPCPAGLDDASVLAAAVRLAVLAPSSHNTQPWRFVLYAPGGADEVPTLALYADRTRALPVVDPDDRALTISCGAALAFLCVALRASGVEPEVRRLPDAARGDLLALVRPGERRVASGRDEARRAAIARRRTCRRPFAARPIPDPVLASLAETARHEGVRLRAVTDADERSVVAGLVAAGDRRQAVNPAFRRELAAWLRPNRSGARDGMPAAVLGIGGLASHVIPWVIRTFDWGGGQAARDAQLAAGSPALMLLGTDDDTPMAWLHTGAALGLMLLDATDARLSASFLNQPIEVPALRPALARALGVAGVPQLLLRMGYGPEVPATPRRGAEEVLEVVERGLRGASRP